MYLKIDPKDDVVAQLVEEKHASYYRNAINSHRLYKITRIISGLCAAALESGLD